MADEPAELVRRFYEELWNRGEVGIADALFASDYVRHDLRPGTAAPGPQGQKDVALLFRKAFPDVHMTIDVLIAAPPFVVVRWTMRGTNTGQWAGSPASGRVVSFCGVNIFRFENGKVVELWNHRDDLGLMEQVGSRIYAGQPTERKG
jgi:steroid delta-isomerase-like uncharacterized protein